MQAPSSTEKERHFIDAKTLTLNHEQSFGVFNRWGDVFDCDQVVQGVFHKGTRYISRLEMKVGDTRPLLLSSTVREDNDVLSVDLVNPAVITRAEPAPQSRIHIRRTKVLSRDTLFEKIEMHSYCDVPVELDLSVELDADFKDIFQLRGFDRKSAQGAVTRRIDGNVLEFSYASADAVERKTVVVVEGAGCEVDERGFHQRVRLDPNESKEIEFKICLLFKKAGVHRLKYRQGLQDLEAQIHQLKQKIGHAHCSNQQFNHWFNRSRLDLVALLARHDDLLYPNAGVPWYNTVFGRDGLITAIQTLNFSPAVAHGVLRYLARHQATSVNTRQDAEPGKILHEVREGELANLGELPFQKYYGSADATPLFVWLAGLYFKRTGDEGTLHEIWPQVKAALKWIDESGDRDGDGFVEYERGAANGLANQGWKDSHDSMSHRDGELMRGPIALCEVQGYVYQAKLMGAMLAEYMGEDDFAGGLRRQAADLRTHFQAAFWDDTLGFVAMALDGEKRPSLVLSSNPGHCLACEILENHQAAFVADKLFSSPLFSGWGIRTLGTDEVRFSPMSYHNGSVWPHDNSMIAFGLAKYKFKAKVMNLLNALFDASVFVELQRIPELYCGFERRKGEGPILYPVACSPQAWAVGSVFLFLSSLLGLEINALKKQIYFRYPVMPVSMNELTLGHIPLGGSRFFDVRCIRYGNDVGLDVIALPDDWEIIIKK